MKNLIKYAFILFALGNGVAAHAQMTFTTTNVTKINDTQWKYGTVTCTSQNSTTSIILSMVNNQVASNSSGITATREIRSLGNNPRTILYLFTPALTSAQVESFVKGITFTKTTEIPSANHTVNISVDANPTHLPEGGSTITAWEHHDGSMHYYVWVPVPASITWEAAYNAAKSYYFQGMRGYLPTMTSEAESKLLTNISELPGWSGGIRTPDNIADQQTITRPSYSNTGRGAIYRWPCGPETGFEYYRGPRYLVHEGRQPMNGAYDGWTPTEPNNAPADPNGAEYVMQVNQSSSGLLWNDYEPTNPNIIGYFIEFGGSGKTYSVGAANYPANPNYIRPTVTTDNAQWHLFTPGNEASTSTSIKRTVMRSNVLVIQ